MTTTLERVRQKCVEANPDLGDLKEGVYYRNPRLADVLLAIDGNWKAEMEVRVDTEGSFIVWKHRPVNDDEDWRITAYSWNLRNDDLEQQSEECVEFIGRTLNV